MKADAPLLTIIGDLGVDLVLGPLSEWPAAGTESVMERSELRAGGSAGNTALAMSYLGAKSRLLSLVGNDDFGAWLAGQFQALDASLPVCNASTSITVGFIHSWGERTFFTTRGHLEKFAYEHVAPQLSVAQSPASIAMLCGVFLTPGIRKVYGQLIDELSSLGYQVALDTGWPPGNWNPQLRAEVEQWVANCDHVLLNELEVSSLANREELNSAIREVAQMLKPGATLVVKTGARGAVGIQSGREVQQGAGKLAIFDTIGAGDSFNAGYLLGRLNGHDLARSLLMGCEAAAAIISRFPRRQIAPGELAGRIALSAPR